MAPLPVDVDVRQDEVAVIRGPFEAQPQRFTHRAACPVAADNPVGDAALTRAIRMRQRGRHALVALLERAQLDLPFDSATQPGQELVEVGLRPWLRQAQQEWIGSVESM